MFEYVVRTGLSIGLLATVVQAVPAITYWTSALGSLLIAAHAVKIVSTFLRTILPKRKLSPYNKAVFVTGCDSGFGHSLAKCLAEYGFEVFAGCLDPTGEGAEQLKTYSSQIHVLKLDVTNVEIVREATKFVKEHLDGKELWALVNNAGIVTVSELEWQDMDRLHSLFEVNTFGMVRMTQAMLPLLRRSKGRVICVNSMSGRVPTTKIGAYSMSKAAGVYFCKILQVEMMSWGVKVCSIEPWVYKTQMSEDEQYRFQAHKEWTMASSEVKGDYGEEYIEAFKDSLWYLTGTGSDKIYQVPDDMMDAVTSKEPCDSYNPGPLLHKMGYWIITLFPRIFMDYFQYMTCPATTPKILKIGKFKSL